MTPVREIIRLLNLPCRDIAALISRSQDETLSRSRRFAVRLHLSYCSACRRYRKHLVVLREAARAVADSSFDPEGDLAPQLSDEARERLRRSLRR